MVTKIEKEPATICCTVDAPEWVFEMVNSREKVIPMEKDLKVAITADMTDSGCILKVGKRINDCIVKDEIKKLEKQTALILLELEKLHTKAEHEAENLKKEIEERLEALKVPEEFYKLDEDEQMSVCIMYLSEFGERFLKRMFPKKEVHIADITVAVKKEQHGDKSNKQPKTEEEEG